MNSLETIFLATFIRVIFFFYIFDVYARGACELGTNKVLTNGLTNLSLIHRTSRARTHVGMHSGRSWWAVGQRTLCFRSALSIIVISDHFSVPCIPYRFICNRIYRVDAKCAIHESNFFLGAISNNQIPFIIED